EHGPWVGETTARSGGPGERKVEMTRARIRSPGHPVEARSDLLVHGVVHDDARLAYGVGTEQIVEVGTYACCSVVPVDQSEVDVATLDLQLVEKFGQQLMAVTDVEGHVEKLLPINFGREVECVHLVAVMRDPPGAAALR